MSKLRILHLSDLHFGNAISNKPENIAIDVMEALETHNRADIDCVVITGDLFDGRPGSDVDKEEFTYLFLNHLREELHLEAEHFVIVPGNHDLGRTSEGPDFSAYTNVLKRFYGPGYYQSHIHDKYRFTTKAYPDRKIAIIGLNSCMIETNDCTAAELKWIEELGGVSNEQRTTIKEAFIKQRHSEWDDYGYVDPDQMRKAFKQLNAEVQNLKDYTLIACFHHHFYPFPEIYDKFGDTSIIRNFVELIEKFQKENVKLVLHGHKHMPIIQPVTNQKYLRDPDSLFYVVSAGSLSCKAVDDRSFEVIDVYDPEFGRLADICRFNYKQKELLTPEEFRIPPQKQYGNSGHVELEYLLKEEAPDLYKHYKTEVYDRDTVSSFNKIDEIIRNISQVITPFESLKRDMKVNTRKLLTLFLSVHYRINYLNRNQETDKPDFIRTLQRQFLSVLPSDAYAQAVFSLLETDRSLDFSRQYEKIGSDFPQCKKDTAYVTIAMYFTDLYLTFCKYGEVYYRNERISTNIQLDEGKFHPNIPMTTIQLKSDVDRRLATIQFKCTDPTVHKIAVLIVKDFEKRISKIEDSLRVLDLKLYYLSPKIEKANYDLDNFNFEAYIPKLLPLLTGDNLYKRKEVFIRELIQNSLDAILLREDLLKKKGVSLTEEEKVIKIIFGVDSSHGPKGERRFIRIVDHGIGMDSFKVERYFTSIGRSFYTSDDFEELQKNEDIDYKPISNFGIGFLSAFMVCREIDVLTKSYDEMEPGLEIHIPNYDGCFFIKKRENEKIAVGTSITIYEDKQYNEWNIQKIIDYIKGTFIDFQLDIEIENQVTGQNEIIKSFQLRRRENTVKIFCPIVDDKIIHISAEEVVSGRYIDKYKTGIMIYLVDIYINKICHYKYINSGIALSDSVIHSLQINHRSAMTFYNLPASILDLDVAREMIRKIKSPNITSAEIWNKVYLQGEDLFKDIGCFYPDKQLLIANRFYKLSMRNGVLKKGVNTLHCKYSLNITEKLNGDIVLSIGRNYNNTSGFVELNIKGLIFGFYYILMNCFKVSLFTSMNISENVDFEKYEKSMCDFFNRYMLLLLMSDRSSDLPEINYKRFTFEKMSKLLDDLRSNAKKTYGQIASYSNTQYIILSSIDLKNLREVNVKELDIQFDLLRKDIQKEYELVFQTLVLSCSKHTLEKNFSIPLLDIYNTYHLFYELLSETLCFKDLDSFRVVIPRPEGFVMPQKKGASTAPPHAPRSPRPDGA